MITLTLSKIDQYEIEKIMHSIPEIWKKYRGIYWPMGLQYYDKQTRETESQSIYIFEYEFTWSRNIGYPKLTMIFVENKETEEVVVFAICPSMFEGKVKKTILDVVEGLSDHARYGQNY